MRTGRTETLPDGKVEDLEREIERKKNRKKELGRAVMAPLDPAPE